jgi:hypothetical protein
MIAFILAFAIAGHASPAPQDPPGLAELRMLARNLLKKRGLGGATARCEVTSIAQVNSCSGPDRNEVTYEVSGDGVLVSRYFRSLGESGNPVGEYRGAPGKEKWRELLVLIAAAKWEDEIGIAQVGPPPGPLESIRIMTLSDGKKTASYSIAGPAPARISKAFNLPGILAMNVTDTVWELSIANPVVRVGKGSLEFQSDWKYKGAFPFRIVLPDSGDPHGCGHPEFKWFLDTSETEVDWNTLFSDQVHF